MRRRDDLVRHSDQVKDVTNEVMIIGNIKPGFTVILDGIYRTGASNIVACGNRLCVEDVKISAIVSFAGKIVVFRRKCVSVRCAANQAENCQKRAF